MKRLALVLFLIAAPALAADPPPKSVAGKVVGVTDGDTIKVLDADKVEHRVRLAGVDAPERKQPFSAKAKEALSKLVFEKEVTVAVTDRDRYGRLVGKVKQGQTDVNTELVLKGWCWRYDAYDKKGEYREAQAEAKAAKRGLWADPVPVPPWEFRAAAKQK